LLIWNRAINAPYSNCDSSESTVKTLSDVTGG